MSLVAEMCLIVTSNQPPLGGFRPEEGFPQKLNVTKLEDLLNKK